MAELMAFFHMGGYAAYVWPAFFISFLVLLANVFVSRAQYRRVLRQTVKRAQTRAGSESTAKSQQTEQ